MCHLTGCGFRSLESYTGYSPFHIDHNAPHLIKKKLAKPSTQWNLQSWSYDMKIIFARRQHDTERTPERGCSHRQLFRYYCGSSGQRVNRKNRSSAEKIPAHSILSPHIELQHPPNHAISSVSGKARVQVSINQSINHIIISIQILEYISASISVPRWCLAKKEYRMAKTNLRNMDKTTQNEQHIGSIKWV